MFDPRGLREEDRDLLPVSVACHGRRLLRLAEDVLERAESAVLDVGKSLPDVGCDLWVIEDALGLGLGRVDRDVVGRLNDSGAIEGRAGHGDG